jgi:hypothetical protein
MSVLDLKSGIKIPGIALQIAAYRELETNGTTEDLEFDPDKHIFTFNGQILPSVTSILRKEGLTPDYSMLDPFYALRGQYVHRAAELYDRGTLDESTIDDEIAPYLVQYSKASKEFPFDIEGIEKKMRHPIYGYAGIIDRTITGNKNYVLYLTKEKYKLEECKTLRADLNVFFGALAVRKWKQANLKQEV